MEFGKNGKKWLKFFHLIFACMWIGSAICLTVKQFFINPSDGKELYGIMSTMNFIDFYILVPGAIGCLITGLMFSAWTPWGWFKHRWIVVKWIICLYGIIFGTYPLGPWLDEMTEISKNLGMLALQDPAFNRNGILMMIFGTFQGTTIIVAALITVFKPWKKSI